MSSPSRERSSCPHWELVTVGASTGGPRALVEFLRELRGIRLPVLLVQHMPASFLASFCEQIGRTTGWCSRLGSDFAVPRGETVFVAPGDRHMVLERGANHPVIRLRDDPPEHHCRPAYDPLLRSAARLFGPRLVAVVLTGMGQDGLTGARAVVDAGGTVVAQDAESSVVWGMPGAVVEAGLASFVAPPRELARWVRCRVEGRVPA